MIAAVTEAEVSVSTDIFHKHADSVLRVCVCVSEWRMHVHACLYMYDVWVHACVCLCECMCTHVEARDRCWVEFINLGVLNLWAMTPLGWNDPFFHRGHMSDIPRIRYLCYNL